MQIKLVDYSKNNNKNVEVNNKIGIKINNYSILTFIPILKEIKENNKNENENEINLEESNIKSNSHSILEIESQTKKLKMILEYFLQNKNSILILKSILINGKSTIINLLEKYYKDKFFIKVFDGNFSEEKLFFNTEFLNRNSFTFFVYD